MSRKWRERRKEKKRREWREVATKNGIKYVKDHVPYEPRELNKSSIPKQLKSPASKPGRAPKRGGLGDSGFRPMAGVMMCED